MGIIERIESVTSDLSNRYRELLKKPNPTNADALELKEIARKLGRSMDQVAADLETIAKHAQTVNWAKKKREPTEPFRAASELAEQRFKEAEEERSRASSALRSAERSHESAARAMFDALDIEAHNPHLWPDGQRRRDNAGNMSPEDL